MTLVLGILEMKNECGRPLVSIIVPAFNAAAFLDQCLNSVVHQQYSNIEIIIENDGSNDDTLHKCRIWQQRHPNIIIYDHENWGVSKSRNHAMERCHGEYVVFVDADDIIAPTYVKILVEMIVSTSADCAVVSMKSGADYKDNLFSSGDTITVQGNQCPLVLFGKAQGFLWNKIYRINIIRNNHLRLDEKIAVGEDLLFNAQYFQFCNRVVVNSGIQYFYRQQYQSAVNNLENVRWFDIIRVHEKLIDFYKNNAAALNVVYFNYVNQLLEAKYRAKFVCGKPETELQEISKRLKKVNFKSYHWTTKQKVKLALFWLFPAVVMKYKRRMLK